MAAEKHRTGKKAAVKEGGHKAEFGARKQKNANASAYTKGTVAPGGSARGYNEYKKYSF